MLFNSFSFLVFFPVTVCLYFLSPRFLKTYILLAASYYFYACWRTDYLVLIIFSTLVDYGAGIGMGRTQSKKNRSLFLTLSLVSNLGLLVLFKYYNLFTDSAEFIADQFNLFVHFPDLKLLLPVGISFYTFQTLSYTIDVYKGKKQPEHNLPIFALYVSFFPQLVAGPIERSTHLLPQFHGKPKWSKTEILSGSRLMLWGFFKKVVIADRLAAYVDSVYNSPDGNSGAMLLLATYAFTFQIYCDFSGYSDIAIGSARILGFDLMENFRRPYGATSIREFWQRWHISLSNWFRDYVYIPMGGNRKGEIRTYVNLMITFLVSGLWHGASWTFVLWGVLHGLYLTAEILIRKYGFQSEAPMNRSSVIKAVKTIITFHLVAFAYIWFRANSIDDAIYISTQILTNIASYLDLGAFKTSTIQLFGSVNNTLFLLALITYLLFYEWLAAKKLTALDQIWVRTLSAAFQFWTIIIFGAFNNQQFIYFQF